MIISLRRQLRAGMGQVKTHKVGVWTTCSSRSVRCGVDTRTEIIVCLAWSVLLWLPIVNFTYPGIGPESCPQSIPTRIQTSIQSGKCTGIDSSPDWLSSITLGI
jgi:hypothetical protein